MEENIDYFQLAVNTDFKEEAHKDEIDISTPSQSNQIWRMFFDGVYTKDGAGEGVVLIPPEGERIRISHKL